MEQHVVSNPSIAATFEAIATADQAIRRLRAAGFTEAELTVACPGKFNEECICATRDGADAGAEAVAGAGMPEAVASGGALGAALGGLALTAAVFTGDLAAPAAVAALLAGGGALIGGLSNLIGTKGSEVDPHDYVRRAIQADRIVVGIEVHGADTDARLAEAEHILTGAGGSDVQRLAHVADVAAPTSS